MADHTRAASAAELVYETANHTLAAKHVAAEVEPPRWNRFNDPTLGQRFKTALEKLERLIYAADGSIPKSKSPFKDWWHRQHPRCNWHAEQWRAAWCGSLDQFGIPICGSEGGADHRYWEFYETAALGRQYSGDSMQPRVPLRSASGDPRWQFATTVNRTSGETMAVDRVHFPLGSVEREIDFAAVGAHVYTTDWSGRTLFDPKGTGDFGGDPEDLVAPTTGQDHVDGDPLEVRYRPPAGKTVLAAQVRFIDSPPSTIAMTLDGDAWKATVPAQGHNVGIYWYLAVQLNSPSGPYWRFDPGGAAEPTIIGETWFYSAYTHYQPYARGLPELWAKCRKGTWVGQEGLTDGYRFDAEETVQYRLINLVRFTLDHLGSRFHHSPLLRSSLPECCLNMPIVWRWSGAAPWPHYREGGKDGVHPLHDRDDSAETDSQLARLSSWRGYPRPYGNMLNWESWAYPGGPMEASWLAPPLRVEQLIPDNAAGTCRTYWTGAGRGLRRGDRIEQVHIEELISAIDYLVQYGLWVRCPIKRRPRSPLGTFLDGLVCGEYHHHRRDWSGTYDDRGFIEPVGYPKCDCCWYTGNTGIGEPSCVHFPAPDDWDECFYASTKISPSDGQEHTWGFGTCPIQETHDKICDSDDPPDEWAIVDETWSVRCGGGSQFSQCVDCGDAQLNNAGCGSVALSARNYDPVAGGNTVRKTCSSTNCGWEAYICGPARAPLGPDNLHGNGLFKGRTNQAAGCPTSQLTTTGGVAYSMGNRFGQTVACGQVVDEIGQMDFETVRSVRWRGACGSWNGWCDDLCGGFTVDCLSVSDLPDAAGLPPRYDWFGVPSPDGHYRCSQSCMQDIPMPGTVATGTNCSLSVPAECMEDEQWCAIDLNLDAGFMPALHDYDPNPEMTSWADRPWADTGHYQTDCPCGTADPTAGDCTEVT